MPDSEQKTGVKTRYGSLTGKEVIFIFLSGIILVVDGILFTNLFVNHFFLQVGPVDYILPLIGMIGFAIVFSVLAILSSQPWMSLVIYLIASILSVSFVALGKLCCVRPHIFFPRLRVFFHPFIIYTFGNIPCVERDQGRSRFGVYRIGASCVVLLFLWADFEAATTIFAGVDSRCCRYRGKSSRRKI